MSLTLLEGLILLTVAGVGGIVWWGVLRLVFTNDQTLKTLIGIHTHLSTINGRLGKTDTWMEMHQAIDEQQFTHMRESLRRIWEKIDKPKS